MGALKRDNPGRGEGGISSRCGECVWGGVAGGRLGERRE